MKFLSKFVLLIILAGMLIFVPGAAMAAGSGQQGDTLRLTGDVYVNEGTTVNGNIVTISGDVYVNGAVTGDVVAVFGDIMVNNGKVLGDAVTVTGKITTGQNGKIMGDSVEALGGVFRTRDKYEYNNDYKFNFDFKPNISISPWVSRVWGIFSSLIFTAVMFGIGCLVYLLMNTKIEKMSATLDQKLGKKIGIGFLTLIGSPIAMVILSIVLAVTIIGILVIPFAWIAYGLLVFTAFVPVYVYIGRKTGGLMSKNRISGYGALAIGMLVMWIINSILSLGGVYTGWINAMIWVAIFVIGTGTLLDFLFTNKKRKPAFIPNTPVLNQGVGIEPKDSNPADDGQQDNHDV